MPSLIVLNAMVTHIHSLSIANVKCTCEVNGANCIDMVVHIGWVRASLAAVLSCKLRPRPYHPDAQPIPARPQ